MVAPNFIHLPNMRVEAKYDLLEYLVFLERKKSFDFGLQRELQLGKMMDGAQNDFHLAISLSLRSTIAFVFFFTPADGGLNVSFCASVFGI